MEDKDEMICIQCHGRGMDRSDKICTRCHGTGYEPGEFEPVAEHCEPEAETSCDSFHSDQFIAHDYSHVR